MFIVGNNTLLNPLNIESVEYVESTILINEKQSGSRIKILMTSGALHEIGPEHRKDINLAMQELVFQIDMACGMKFEPKAVEETPPDVDPS